MIAPMKTLATLLVVSIFSAAAFAQAPSNLAPKARITASSIFSKDYQARFVASGRVPDGGGRNDLRQAWCVDGRTHRHGAEISFAWDEPVTVSEVIYYGRTAWFLEECWKDFELFAENSDQTIARGQFEMRSGPQRIRLSNPIQTTQLRLNFTSSYGGLNPGASEIQIFSKSPGDRELRRLSNFGGPPIDEPEVNHLRQLLGELGQTHGAGYSLHPAHSLRLSDLHIKADAGQDMDQSLLELQREILLFDVEKLLVVERHDIDSSHVYTYHNEGFRAGGGLYVVALSGNKTPGEKKQLVSSPNGQILDCDLSYDGQKVLFSWRRQENEGYHLWTINADGTGLTQLTRGEWHDYNGAWLPDGGIAFVSTRDAQFAYCWNSPVGVLHRMEADGSRVVRLSANYLNDFTPYPLEDGRIIYGRWEYVDKPAIPIQSLWTIYPDGTGLAGYYGNRVISPGTFMEARSIPGTDLIVCTMTGHNGPARGAIGVIDRSRGDNAQEAILNVTPEVTFPAVDKGNGNFDGRKPYSTPIPLDKHRFLVSARGPVLVRNFSGTCQSTALEPPGNGMQWVCAQPVRPRSPGRVVPGMPKVAGANPESTSAYLYLQDIYNGLEPAVKRGEIQTVRVVREMPKNVRIHPDKRAFGFQFPVISAGATYAAKEVLGEADVDADGSAYFEVPSGVPIYFIALDKEGRALQRMRSFTHLMPGEVQGCVGCHESRNQLAQPPQRTFALARSPQKLRPPEWGPGGFDYAGVVQPVLDRHCVSCHGGPAPDGKVDLSGDKTDYFNVSYETLARGRRQSGEAQWENPYVSWIPTYNGFEANILQVAPLTWGSPKSKLADLLLAGHPDPEGKPRIEMDEADRRRILAWIDLNVPYYGTSETTHPDNPGSRRIYPRDLDKTLASVASRRCADCHSGGKIPRQFWTRITNPHLNEFLLAPLAKSAGGTERCGKAVFADTHDPDYQAVLGTFAPALAELERMPRIDMPGAVACTSVDRSCR
jgi:hypothetical protein